MERGWRRGGECVFHLSCDFHLNSRPTNRARMSGRLASPLIVRIHLVATKYLLLTSLNGRLTSSVLRPVAVCVDVKTVHIILKRTILDSSGGSMNASHTLFQSVPCINSCHVSGNVVRHNGEHWHVCCNKCQPHRERSQSCCFTGTQQRFIVVVSLLVSGRRDLPRLRIHPASLNNSTCRGPCSCVTTRYPSLSCTSASLFKIVTGSSSLASHYNFARLLKIITRSNSSCNSSSQQGSKSNTRSSPCFHRLLSCSRW